MSSGARGLFGEVASWLAGLGLIAIALVYHQELKAVAGTMLGVPTAEQMAAQGGERVALAQKAGEPRTSGNAMVEIPAGPNGHFHVTAEINGRSIEVMVDSGASLVAMPYEDAERAGIYVKDSDFTARAMTANGSARFAPVTIDRISIGDITVRGVRASVAERGRLNQTLLGMSFLGRLQRADMRSGVLVLQE